jgi:hypothetical protein
VKIVYIAVDGDDVGSHLEYLMLMNDIETLAHFAAEYTNAMQQFIATLTNIFRISVIFLGGDSLLLTAESAEFSVNQLETVRTSFAENTRHTLSIGLGYSAREAYIALKLAKTSGKNCIRRFVELSDV